MLRRFLPLAFVVTVLCGLVYIGLQQEIRMSANDLPRELAEDAAVQLGNGAAARSVIASQRVDIARSLAPFLIVYDGSGHVLVSSAILDGEVPTIPPGVIASAKVQGENALTWQPKKGVRQAIVAKRYTGKQSGVVVAGQSLRAREERIDRLLPLVFAAWIVALVGSFILQVIGRRREHVVP